MTLIEPQGIYTRLRSLDVFRRQITVIFTGKQVIGSTAPHLARG